MNELKLRVLHFETKKQWEINNIINFIPIVMLWIAWIWFLNSNILDDTYYLQLKWISIFPLTFLTIISDLFRFRNNTTLIFSVDSLKLVKSSSVIFISWSDIEEIKIFKQNWKSNLYNRNFIIEVVQKDKNIVSVILENSLFNFGFFRYKKILKFLEMNSILKSIVKNNGGFEITSHKLSSIIS